MLLNQQKNGLHKRKFKFAFISELSYRIPKQVTHVIKCRNGSAFPICPKCGISMDREYIGYCDRCGQRLNWDSFDFAVVCNAPISK